MSSKCNANAIHTERVWLMADINPVKAFGLNGKSLSLLCPDFRQEKRQVNQTVHKAFVRWYTTVLNSLSIHMHNCTSDAMSQAIDYDSFIQYWYHTWYIQHDDDTFQLPALHRMTKSNKSNAWCRSWKVIIMRSRFNRPNEWINQALMSVPISCNVNVTR